MSLERLFKSGRFPHALLIEGAAGSGRRQLSLYAAAMLLCRGEKAPCGECIACRKLQSLSHPDLVTVDGTDKRAFAIDAVRALRQEGWRAPNESERRVFLLTEVQNMPIASQNALLKLIEEPPEHLHFIFTVTSRGALLDTVLSRVTLITMNELSSEERLDVLGRIMPDGGEEIKNAAAAFPTVGQALASLKSETAQKRVKAAEDIFVSLENRDRYGIMKALADFEKDRDALIAVLEAFRTLCIGAVTSGKAGFSALQCGEIVAIIEKAEARIRQNVGTALLSAVFAGEITDVLIPARGKPSPTGAELRKQTV